MNKPLLIVISLCLAIASSPLLAADIKNGRQLQQKNCMSCHDDSMYTRDNRRINDLSGLRTQVQRCESTLGLTWFDEEVDDVTAYLNKSFYKFK
ncbi:MAG: cytochrome c [Gammaproteobacteria bacterium]